MFYLLAALSYQLKEKKILVTLFLINNLNNVFIFIFYFCIAEDFQIDELAIHGGEWNENVYTADCSVLDGVSLFKFMDK
jgi:hypothetical protein